MFAAVRREQEDEGTPQNQRRAGEEAGCGERGHAGLVVREEEAPELREEGEERQAAGLDQEPLRGRREQKVHAVREEQRSLRQV